MAFMFENLEVYQKAVDFADHVATAVKRFPRGYAFLADQLNRASLLIAANIAEGNGRFSKPDRRNFFGISPGSIQKFAPLLKLAARRLPIDEDRHAKMKCDMEGIAKILSGLISRLDNRSM